MSTNKGQGGVFSRAARDRRKAARKRRKAAKKEAAMFAERFRAAARR